MSPPAVPRRVAILLLRYAIAIAPRETLDWGHAMLAELCQVQGNWAALLWSLGSAGVLIRHALLAWIFPSRNRPTVPPVAGAFSKEGPMRKSTVAAHFCSPPLSRLFCVADHYVSVCFVRADLLSVSVLVRPLRFLFRGLFCVSVISPTLK